MTTDPVGVFLLGVAVISIVIGNVFIRRITTIRV
jgi:Flp pilus assembly protein TadB